jgi:hypothetical protein
VTGCTKRYTLDTQTFDTARPPARGNTAMGFLKAFTQRVAATGE